MEKKENKVGVVFQCGCRRILKVNGTVGAQKWEMPLDGQSVKDAAQGICGVDGCDGFPVSLSNEAKRAKALGAQAAAKNGKKDAPPKGAVTQKKSGPLLN